MVTINREKLSAELAKEIQLYKDMHPNSAMQAEKSKANLLTGNGMNWWGMWAGGFPMCIKHGTGATITDIDGNTYTDFCLGDTGAMTGHAPKEALDVIAEKLYNGSSFMMPTEDHLWVAEELQRRFGLSHWQYALSASDANRFAIRWARFATGRLKTLVFNHSYHGSVDEALAELDGDGNVVPKDGNLGYGINPAATTKVIEFNDIEAARKALEPGDVAIALIEPALTNMSIVSPEPGFLEELSELCRETGTVFLMDETHTISEGYGGYVGTHNIRADMIVVGKPIASGIPAAVYGFSSELADRIAERYPDAEKADSIGVGTTLTGSAISVAAIRATLEHVLTKDAYEHMGKLADRYTTGLRRELADLGLDWSVIQSGSRIEYLYDNTDPKNGSDVYNSFKDYELNAYSHLSLLNAGYLLAPFHNMALMCPATTEEQVDGFLDAFRASILRIVDHWPQNR